MGTAIVSILKRHLDPCFEVLRGVLDRWPEVARPSDKGRTTTWPG